MRWRLREAEFDFKVEYTPGSNIPHEDAFSRNVSIVRDELNVT